MKPNIVYAILIVILGFALYANSVKGEFVWDDSALVADNIYIRDWHNIPKLFTQSIGAGADKYSRAYRPMQMLSYSIDFLLWKTDIRGYHRTNILLHILVALSLFRFISLLFGDSLLAFITSILYISHPIHPEAVSYISGRADPLAALFILLASIFYIKDKERKNAVVIVLMVLSYIAALLSRESSIIFPILLLAYHFSFRKRLYLGKFSLICAITFAYILLRLSLLSYLFSKMPAHPPFFQRIPGFFVALANYIRLLILPFGLHMEYGAKVFSITNPRAILGLLILVVFAYFGFRRRKASAILNFSILWFLAALLPSSNIYPVNAYMAEHWLYLPSIGFFLIIADGLVWLYNRREYRIMSVLIITSLVIFYTFLTIKQNRYWLKPIPFYERTIEYSPDSPKVYYNLANTYKNEGRFKEAIDYYKKSISIEPKFSDSYNNMGNIYNLLRRYREAIDCYKKAIEIDPDFVDSYNNLGIVYNIIGNNEDAMSSYKKAIELNPNYAIAYNGIGVIYALKGANEEALAYYKKAIEADPAYYNAYNNLATIYHRMGRREEAISGYLKAIEINPRASDAYSNLAEVYAALGRHKEAIELCEKAIERDPDSAKAYYNMANSLSALGRHKEALEFYKKSLDKKPDNPYTYNNMGMAYNELGMANEAVSAYKKAITLKPDYAHPYNNLGMIYYNLGNYNEALELFKRAAEAQPDYAIAYFNMSLAYYKLGQYKPAVANCDKAIALGHKPDQEFMKLLKAQRI